VAEVEVEEREAGGIMVGEEGGWVGNTAGEEEWEGNMHPEGEAAGGRTDTGDFEVGEE
jgi:hypothetical protein